MAESKLVWFGALAAGIVIGGLIVTVAMPKPTEQCSNPPEAYVTVTIAPDPDNAEVFVVNPEEAGPAEQCDLVVFVNTTGKEVSIDFGAPEKSSGTPFEQNKYTIEENESGQSTSWAPQVVVPTPREPENYHYTVTVEEMGGTEQSPVIRIGPRSSARKD